LDKLTNGDVVPLAGEEDAPVREAEGALRALEQRGRDAEAMVKRTEGTRAKIAELLAEAATKERNARPEVSSESWERSESAWSAAGEEVIRLKELLAEAEQKHRRLAAAMDDLSMQRSDRKRVILEVEALRARASDLENTLSATTIQPPTDAEISAAIERVDASRAHAAMVMAARAAHAAMVEHAAICDELAVAEALAKQLDQIVDTLTTRAPAEMAGRSQSIVGLTFIDDDIALDGKPFSNLCGTETIELCTEVARRMNPKGKLLRVNGLEQLDPETMEAFVKVATRDGWQLIGTRVEAGDLQIVGIEPDDESLVCGEQTKKPKRARLTIEIPKD
jgi:hypothetical protein